MRQKIKEFLNLFRRIRCVVCEKSSWGFNSEGNPPRMNASCPKCGAYERHRLMWMFLKSRTDLLRHPQRMLHIAPERSLRAKLEKVETLDYLTSEFDLTKPATYHFDVTHMLVPSNSFDVVMINHVFEHVKNHATAIKEVLRILKPGGWAIMQVPICYGMSETLDHPGINTPELRRKFYGEADHVRYYGEDYPAFLQTLGFNVETIDFIKEIGLPVAKRHWLDRNEKIYFCSKPIKKAL